MTNGEAIIAAQQTEIASLRAQLADANANAEQGWLACGAVRDEADDLKAQLATARKAIHDACDLLSERSYGSDARSPGHNARLKLEAALSATAAPNLEEPRG